MDANMEGPIGRRGANLLAEDLRTAACVELSELLRQVPTVE